MYLPDGYTGIYTAEDFDNIRNDLSGTVEIASFSAASATESIPKQSAKVRRIASSFFIIFSSGFLNFL